MRLQADDYGFDALLPDNEQESTIENSAKMFSILSDALYKNKILAVIRELSCNARDSHHDAKKLDVPFKLKLPTRLEPTFRIEDSGIGIAPADMVKVYLTYGRSTKTEDDNAIGALGLGSKSPFAYTKSSFIVKTRWHTPPSIEAVQPVSEYTFFIFINRQGKPALSLVGIEPCDMPMGGLTVEFATKPEDILQFIAATDKFYRYWEETLPEFIDYSRESVLTTKIQKVISGTDWYLEKRESYSDHSGAIAVMGNVPYPILADQIIGLPEELKIIARSPFIIKFPLGSFAFSPSREDISYDEFSCKNLIERLEAVRAELAQTTKDQIFAAGQTQVSFRMNFFNSVQDLIRSIRVDRYTAIDPQWMVKFALGVDYKSSVTYDGHSYLIDDLMTLKHNDVTPGYVPFGIVSREVRGSRSRVYQHQSTVLHATALKEMDYDQIRKSDASWHRKVNINDKFDMEWQSKVFLKRKDADDYSQIQRMFLLEDSFKWDTITRLNVNNSKVVFVVNDEGNIGEYKYKCYLEIARPIGNYFYVRFNPKEFDSNAIFEKVTAFTERGLKGAEVVFVSSLEDHRPPIAKVKPETGTVKLNYHTFTHYPDNSQRTNVETYMGRKSPVDVIKIPTYDGHVQQVFKLSELANGKPWLYVIKNRSRREIFDYDHVRNSLDGAETGGVFTSHSCLKFASVQSAALLMAITAGFFSDVNHLMDTDDLKRRALKYTVLVLNEGQIKWLKAKGVKLAQVRLHLIEKINLALDNHNFINDISEEVVMEKVDVLRNFYPVSTKDQRDRIYDDLNGGTFQKYLKEFEAYTKTRDKKLNSYMLMAIYRAFVSPRAAPSDSRVEIIKNLLFQSYPMLRLVELSRLTPNDLDSIIDYILEQDSKTEVVI